MALILLQILAAVTALAAATLTVVSVINQQPMYALINVVLCAACIHMFFNFRSIAKRRG